MPVPFEFIQNIKKQLTTSPYTFYLPPLESSPADFSLLPSVWGETEQVEYLEVKFIIFPNSNSLKYDKRNPKMEEFLAHPQTSNWQICDFKVSTALPNMNERFFHPVSEQDLLLIQKAMRDIPVRVRLFEDEQALPDFSSLFSRAPVIKKLVNCLQRIEHFFCNLNDPFVEKIVIRSIAMGSLRRLDLSSFKLSKKLVAKIAEWLRGREFQSLGIRTNEEDMVCFDRLVNAICEIAKEYEQTHSKTKLVLRENIATRIFVISSSVL
ncbi:hypothetical protein L596_009968 [Steinernema carpocapsae]|uniref:Uncharacterized protein n=1 Tax=Steinernema carpocapsae TaxID=34508 RepID=A0A4V6A6Q4_STECR|nr:hypothetical protein L596_009968 [Steinernema carpocapsae]